MYTRYMRITLTIYRYQIHSKYILKYRYIWKEASRKREAARDSVYPRYMKIHLEIVYLKQITPNFESMYPITYSWICQIYVSGGLTQIVILKFIQKYIIKFKTSDICVSHLIFWYILPYNGF